MSIRSNLVEADRLTEPNLRLTYRFVAAPSSSGLGLWIFVPATGVQIPMGSSARTFGIRFGFFYAERVIEPLFCQLLLLEH